MKILYTLFIALVLTAPLHAQPQTIFNLSFEDTTVINRVYYTDSIIDSLGIWQIAASTKPFFTPSYSPPYAVITLLDSALPANTKASFIITIPLSQDYDFMGSILTFTHKYDFDSAHGGGYVEFSVDTGLHWHGVYTTGAYGGHYTEQGYSGFCVEDFQYGFVDGHYVYPPTWWGTVPHDTISEGIAYFTGTDSVWIQDTIVMPSFIPEKTNQLTSYMFRFTSFTDTVSLPRAGWIIDNIGFENYFMGCGSGINELNSSHLRLYPDPATDGFTLTVSGEPGSHYEYSLYDLSGRAMLQGSFAGQEVVVKRGDIASGAYFIQVTDRRTHSTYQKRMIFE